MHLVSRLFKTVNLPYASSLPLELQIKFLQRLANLLEKGYSLLHALTILQYDPELKEIAKQIMELLTRGHSLDKALQTFRFSRYVNSFLYFSRQYGNLTTALRESSRFLSKQQMYQKKFRKVIHYPAMLFLFLTALLLSVKTFLLPSFLQLYSSMSVQSSSLLLLLKWMNISMYVFLLLVVISLVSVIWWKVKSKHLSTSKVILLYTKIPLLNQIVRTHTTYLFTYHFSSLLKSGMLLKNGLIVISKQSHFRILQHNAIQIYDHLEKGGSLSNAVLQCELFHRDLAKIIHHNETDGRLQEDLEVYAEWMVEDMEQKILKWLSSVQPILFSTLALLIVAIYLSIMMPILDLMKLI